MTNPLMPSRPRLHRLVLPVLLLLGVLLPSLAAVIVESDGLDTGLGAVAGASAVLLLALVLYRVWRSRANRKERDLQALDGLEPLRAARRDTGR